MDKSVVFDEREGSAVSQGIQLGSKYFLGEQIGRGAMGVVYDATTTGGDSLAIKLLRPELATDDKTVARFIQERQIFRRIDHPNVVRVDDLVAEGDQLGIAMEKVAGGDLRQRIESRSLGPVAAMGIAADVAAGLEAIHAADVVHRDLKPANILLAETPDGLQPKISDFGISRLVSEAMTRTSTTIGTPLYMAPEAADRRGADAPADIYSLGAMMFELLIGAAPFHEGGTFAVLRAHAQDPPPFIEGVPSALSALIDEMLAKNPADRPTASQVRPRLMAIIPTIDDSITPAAIGRTPGEGSSEAPVASGAETEPGTSAAAGAGVAAAAAGVGVAAAAAGVGVAAAVGAAGAASDSAETVIVDDADPQPNDSAETRISSEQLPPMVPAEAGTTTVAAIATPSAANAFANQVPPSGSSAPPASSGPALGQHAMATGPTSMGVAAKPRPGAALLDRLPNRASEIGLAMVSLAALVAVAFFAFTRGGGDDSASGVIESVGGPTTQVDVGSGGSGLGGGPGSGGDGAGGGPGMFVNDSDNSDDGSGGDGSGGASGGDSGEKTVVEPTSTTSSSTSTTTRRSTTTTGANTTTTQRATTTTRPTTTTTWATTTTTKKPTTTTTWATTTTTKKPTTTTTWATTTTLGPLPIQIVSGVSTDSVGPTRFHFDYFTNDVCGTGSFSVIERDTGIAAGSFTGENICYGPRHGGFPGHSSFPGFSLKPATTYRVNITVRGTASDGARRAGSGSASTSFIVTTSG